MAKRILLASVVLMLLTAALWRLCTLLLLAEAGPAAAGPPPDPRLTSDGPFQNINPNVKYVGDAICTGCHDDIAAKYRKHPMGRSLTALDEVRDEPIDGQGNNHVVKELQFSFRMQRHGKNVIHRQTRLDNHGQSLWEFDL